ncbi:MAG: hypothetical protein WC781_03520 [Candidatus Pacearchaeota archaeon]|jgi:hypothetical protein
MNSERKDAQNKYKNLKRICLGIGICGWATATGCIGRIMINDWADNKSQISMQEYFNRSNTEKPIYDLTLMVGGFAGVLGLGYAGLLRREENIIKPYDDNKEA